MKNIQFDSLYKFIVSIGVIIAVFPVSILYVIFKDNSNILVTNKEMEGLTEVAQKILSKKQAIIIQLVNNNMFYFLLGLIGVVGIFLIYIGLKNWKKVQEQIDFKTILENRKLEKEIGISTQDNINKVKNEITLDMELLGNNVDRNNAVLNYIEVESAIAKKIIMEFGNTYEVVQGARIGSIEYDIIASSKVLMNKDYIFEVKYIKAKINDAWVHKVIDRIERQAENYSAFTSRLPYKILIVVAESNNYEQAQQKVCQINKINNFKIVVVHKDKIKDLQLK